MTGRRRWIALALVFGLCLFTWTANANAEKTFKIGVLGPFTGGSAKVGAEFKCSVEMALEKIGYKVGDYKIEVVWVDTQYDPAKAASAYSEAVEKGGIQIGIMEWSSSVTMAIMDMAIDYGVPQLFPLGSAQIVVDKWRSNPEKYKIWSTKGWPVPGTLIKEYVGCLNDSIARGLWKPEKKLVAVYGEDTDYGRSEGAAFEAAFKELGWEIASVDYFPVSQTDFYNMLSRYKSKGVAVLAGASNYPAMGSFVKQASEVGLKSLIIGDGIGWTGNWYEQTGNASNYMLDMIPQMATPQAQAWAKSAKEKCGFTPSAAGGALVYDYFNFALKIFKRALDQYGVLDKDSVIKVVKNELQTGKLTYKAEDGALIMKEYKFTPETLPDPVVGPDHFFFPVVQYFDGKGVIVYPPSVKQGDFKAKK
ncbi:MAG: ABC transporter substrate-binding protein [Deltaproteobacteria bacterium]|nr:ABC transporter substrate-binding protein [Deltaproteobacteria bacterium]